jgi:hypothetical protein
MCDAPSPSFAGVLSPPSIEAISASGRDRIDARHSPSRDFLDYIAQFRAVAIIFIVAGHSFFPTDWNQ